MNAHFLSHSRTLPARDAAHSIVTWRVFRDPHLADEFAAHVMLGDGQHLAGGYDRDSLGLIWRVGVEVDDLPAWGNRAAVNKHAE